MGVMRPELVMKSIVPVVMAGVLGIYGLIIAVIISTGSKSLCCRNYVQGLGQNKTPAQVFPMCGSMRSKLLQQHMSVQKVCICKEDTHVKTCAEIKPCVCSQSDS